MHSLSKRRILFQGAGKYQIGDAARPETFEYCGKFIQGFSGRHDVIHDADVRSLQAIHGMAGYGKGAADIAGRSIGASKA